MNKYAVLLKNTAWIFIGSFGSRFMQFLLLPFFTAYLTPGEYGIKDLITVYASVLVCLTGCKLEDAVFFHMAGASVRRRAELFTSALLFSLLQSVLLTVVLYLVSGFSSPSGFFAGYWIWLAGITACSGLFLLLQEFCRGCGRLSVYSVSGMLYTAGTVAGALLLIPRFGIRGYLTAVAAGYLTAVVYILISVGSGPLFAWPREFGNTLKTMLRFSLPLIPHAVLWMLLTSLNRPLLEKWYSLAEVGLLAVANKIPLLLDSVWGILFNSWQISAVNEFRNPGFSRYFNRIGTLLLEFFTLLCCILAVGAPYYVPLLPGREYHGISVFIPMLLLSVLFSILTGFIGSVFTASGRSVYFLYSTLAAAVMAVVLNFLLIPGFGIWGAVFALCITMAGQFFFRCLLARKIVRFTGIAKKLAVISGYAVVAALPFVPVSAVLRLIFYIAVISCEIFVFWHDSKVFRHLGYTVLLAKSVRGR